MSNYVHITIRKGKILIKSPYNRLFVELLKVNVPWQERSWNKLTALWSVDVKHRATVIDLIQQCYGRDSVRWEVDDSEFFGPDEDEAERREQARQQEEARRQSARDREERAREQRYQQEERARAWRDQQERRRTSYHSNGHGPYGELFVTADAPVEVIDAAYRALIKFWHPDRNNHPQATERTQAINAAYDAVRKSARPLR